MSRAVHSGGRSPRPGTVEVRRNPVAGESDSPSTGMPVSRRQFVALIALAALGLVAFSFGRVAFSSYQLSNQASRLRGEIASLQAEHRRLQEQTAELQTDAAIERLARERLGWTRPGEIAIVVVETRARGAAASPGSTGANSAAEVAPTIPERPANWQRWQQLFFGS